MLYSVTAAAAALAMLPSIVAGAPSVLRRQSPSIPDISNAQNQWSHDTAVVSNFLSNAEGLSGQELVDQATIALNAELDELNQKKVLDSVFVFVSNPDPNVQQANNELVDQGTFQFVVNGLQNLADNGANMSPDQVSQIISDINNDRCPLVLPSIDTYFRAAAGVVQNGVTLVANRPRQC